MAFILVSHNRFLYLVILAALNIANIHGIYVALDYFLI